MSSTTDNEQRFAYLLSPEFQIVNTAGKPLTGGWIEVYIHGTRVKYYCFSDFDGTLHPFQIPLDSLGSNIVLASPTHAYDIYIYNKFGALVMSRYNVVPACNAADIVEDVVVIDSPDETINVTCDGGSNWHLEVNTDLIATTEQLAAVSGDLQDQIDNKKDLQLPYVASGSVTKTITKIEQNENGEIEVTYSDIDLPPQVPNIDIISPSGTIDVSSVVNPSTNTKTFKIDIHKTKMDFFDGYCGRNRYEYRSGTGTDYFGLYVDQWEEYKYQGNFIANSWQDENNINFVLNSGLYLITATIRYQMNKDFNQEEYIRIATGAYNGLETGTRYKDWSNEVALGEDFDESSIQISFIRNVEDDDDYTYMNGNHYLYFMPELPIGVRHAFIDHLQIVKLDSIAAAGGGSGPRYAAGYGIEILDDVIQVATGTVVTNNYFNTVVSSINNEINEINTTIQNVTGDITELNEAVTNIVGVTGDFVNRDEFNAVTGDITNINEAITNIIGATGDFATTDYVDAAVSGLENYSAGQYISIEDHVISVTGLQPEGDYATTEYVDNRIASAAGDVYEAGQYVSIENNVINVTGVQPAGDYATNEDLQIVSGAIPESEDVEFEELDLTQFAQASAVTVIQNQINNVTGDINNINEAVTNIIGATGDYATEEYVDEAIAAVTGQPFEQVNSDWLATSGVAEILNKPDVFQLIAGDNIDITPSGNDLVISASGDVDKAYVDEQVAEVSAAIPESEEVEFQEIDIDNYALASAIPSLDGYATEEYVDNKVASATFEQVNSDWLATSGVAEILNKPLEANIVAGQNISIVQEYDNVIISATGIPSLDGYATEQYVDDAIVAATGMIPEAQVNADWLATSGKAEILNKPQEEAVEFEEVNLADYALASAIPDVSNFVTQQDIDDSIAPVQSQIDTLAAATGDYLTEQVNADWNATSGVSEILNKPESEEVQFEEVDLSVYALASAIPSLDGYATEQYVDNAIATVTGIIPSDVVTEQELADAIDAATGLIPDVSALEADIQTVSGAVDAVSGAIPESEEVEFEELDLSIYALASAVPDVTQLETAIDNLIAATGDYATETYVDAAVTAVDSNIFWAVANGTNITTYAEITAAVQAGKKVLVVNQYTKEIFVPTGWYEWISAHFNKSYLHSESGYPHLERLWITSDNVWHWDSFTIPYIGTNGVVVNGGEISVTGYATEQYVDTAVAGYATEAYVDSVVTGYATEAYVDAAISAVTGGSFEQVNADWDATSGVAEILNKPETEDVTVGNVIAGDNISITASGDDIVISSTGGGTGDVTEAELATVSGVLESEIQTVSAAIPDTSIYATETDLQTVSAAIPESESVEFEELDLSDYALASAIPDVTNINTAITNLVAATGDYLQDSDLNGYATEAYVDAAITGATFEQVNSDWNATSGVAEILNKPVPKEVEFKEVDLSDFALASAVSGKQDVLTGITDVQVVQTLPVSPVATVLYLIPEA